MADEDVIRKLKDRDSFSETANDLWRIGIADGRSTSSRGWTKIMTHWHPMAEIGTLTTIWGWAEGWDAPVIFARNTLDAPWLALGAFPTPLPTHFTPYSAPACPTTEELNQLLCNRSSRTLDDGLSWEKP